MRSGGSVTASYNAFKTTSYSLTQWQGYMSLKENVSFFLLAIGVQQWGNAGNSGGSVDVTFPISFTKTVYQIQLTYNNSSYENPTYAIKDTKSFSYWSKYGGDKLWLAIGAQQWGYAENTSVGSGHAGTYSASFPIAFSTVYQIVCSTVKEAQSYKGAPNIYSYTTSTVTFSTYDGWYVDKAMYIAVGR